MTDTLKRGRPIKYSDETILEAIEAGADTLSKILEATGMKHKSTLMMRLRRLQEAGEVSIVERQRYAGFTVTSER